MTLTDLASIGTFISAIAVLVSLVYLSLQIRQTARNQAIAIQQQRLNFAQALSARTAAADMAGVWVRGLSGDATLDDVEMSRFLSTCVAWLQGHEDDFVQHRAKLLDAERFRSNTFWLRSIVTTPGMRAVWASVAEAHHPAFRAFVDTLLRETPAASNVLATVRVAAAAELARMRAIAAPSA